MRNITQFFERVKMDGLKPWRKRITMALLLLEVVPPLASAIEIPRQESESKFGKFTYSYLTDDLPPQISFENDCNIEGFRRVPGGIASIYECKKNTNDQMITTCKTGVPVGNDLKVECTVEFPNL